MHKVVIVVLSFLASEVAVSCCENINCRFGYIGYKGLSDSGESFGDESAFLAVTAINSAIDRLSPLASRDLRLLNYRLYSLERAYFDGAQTEFTNEFALLEHFVHDFRMKCAAAATDRAGELFHNNLLICVAERVEYSLARMIVSKIDTAKIPRYDIVERIIPDSYFLGNYPRNSERMDKVLVFRNMIELAIAVMRTKMSPVAEIKTLSCVDASERLLICPGGRRIVYEENGPHWLLRCQRDAQVMNNTESEWIPIIASSEWYNLHLDDEFNSKRVALYSGTELTSLGGKMEWFVDHQTTRSSNCVHNVLFQRSKHRRKMDDM